MGWDLSLCHIYDHRRYVIAWKSVAKYFALPFRALDISKGTTHVTYLAELQLKAISPDSQSLVLWLQLYILVTVCIAQYTAIQHSAGVHPLWKRFSPLFSPMAAGVGSAFQNNAILSDLHMTASPMLDSCFHIKQEPYTRIK